MSASETREAPDLPARLRAILAIDPAAPSLEFDDHWSPWSELASLVYGIDGALSAAGLGEGTAVAILLRNRPSLLGAMTSVIASRRCVLTVNAVQGASGLGEEITRLRPAVVIAHADDWAVPALRDAADAVGCLGIEVEDGPALAWRLAPGHDRIGVGPHHAPLPGVAVQMLTSGTTGPPKRIPLTLDALSRSLASAARYESKDGDAAPRLASGVVLLPNPLVHVGGIFRALGALYSGRRISILERFDVAKWHALVVRHRPKAVSLVPAALKAVLEADLPREDLSSLRAASCGTAPLAPEVAEAFEAKYGIPVLTTYGATEFAGGVAGWTLADHRKYATSKRGSSGRANAGVEIRVVAPDGGAPLGPDAPGLLEVKTKQHSAKSDWVRTTDLARIDADGFLFVLGRADGAINRGGFKLVPGEIEQVLERHPSVAEVSVVGLPDARLGEVPVAAAVLREGAPAIDEEALAAFAKEHLTGYQRPVRYRIVDALPRTPALKVSQPGVRALFGAPGE